MFVQESADIGQELEIGAGSEIPNLTQVGQGTPLRPSCIIGGVAYADSGVMLGNICKLPNCAGTYEATVVENGVFIRRTVGFTNDHFPAPSAPTGRRKSRATGNH